MKASQLIFLGMACVAGTTHAQLVAPMPDPVLHAESPAAMRSVPTFPRLDVYSHGLPPADPAAPYLYRPDPKLYAAIELSPVWLIEATFTNPNYVDRLTYLGPGPRLAQGVPLRVGGYDFRTAVRLTLPVDDQLSTFGRLGVAVSERQRRMDTLKDVGPAASVGATYKLNSKQTATMEIPLSPIERKEMSGSASGYGARLKLGF